MGFLAIGISIILLVLFIVWFKVEPFISFLLVSVVAGILLGIPLDAIMGAVQKGIGDLLGGLVIIITLGAMLGKIVADSGAAQRIAEFLMRLFGQHRIHWAITVTAFVVGIPLFFNVGFVLLVPLVFTVSYQYKIPAMFIGVPMLAALSVTHGLLPPHPAPVALVAQFDANMGLTLIYGLIIAVPVILLAGPGLARLPWIRTMEVVPLDAFRGEAKPSEALPSLGNSLVSALLPVFLLIATSLILLRVDSDSSTYTFLAFVGDPGIVMLFSLLWATVSLGLRKGRTIVSVMDGYGKAVKDIALVILIIAGAGAFKEVLVSSGISADIATAMEDWNTHPLLLGWLIAAIIRISVGSATVAALTAAGIIGPLVGAGDVNPNLMVLAIGSGSLIFSHFNDGGFWLVKEYFNLSVKQTLLSWSLVETVAAIGGLFGVLAMDLIL
ncbi:MAG: gluconate transporter [Lunatimonas sp.]|uniref:gluconate:H+ symporter n=1 Tax=Lunatimonas sp. TaxID=2060141 RepID=UPI00263BAD92|nr:gluconate:H+ symporter [Lunatimonas sp.]MCC5937359.1 gluconate transporter [Lunatimonas sp.]